MCLMDAHYAPFQKWNNHRKVHPYHAGQNFANFKAVCKYSLNGIINTKMPGNISQFNTNGHLWGTSAGQLDVFTFFIFSTPQICLIISQGSILYHLIMSLMPSEYSLLSLYMPCKLKTTIKK